MSKLTVAIGTLTLLLGGCALPPSPEELANADFGSYPSNYEATIRSYMSTRLKDPYSAQYQFLNAPQRGFQGFGGAKYGYVVCAQVNAKNSFGGYTGGRPAYFLIRNDVIIDSSIGDGSYADAFANGKCEKFVGRY